MTLKGISLFKKNGVYYLAYTDELGNRKQKSTRCKYKPDALKILSDFNKFVSDGNNHKPTSFSAFTKDFLKYAETNLSKTTVTIYAHAFKQFLRICGDMDLEKMSQRQWDEFKTCRLNDKVSLRRKYNTQQESEIALANQPVISAVSVNIELRHIKSALGVAEKWNLITTNPFGKGSLVTISQKTPAFLTVQDAEVLISSITKEWLRDIVIFALNTGMRRNEILFLRWIDIDAENRVARITNRQGFHTKSGLERSVSLNDTAMMVLNRRKASSIMSDYIFTDDIGRQLLPSRVTHAFKDAVRSSNLSPYLQQHLHAHSLRHSFISQLAVLGTPAFLISRLAGHNSTQTTAIYMHLNPKLNSLHSEVSKLSFGMSPYNPLQN